MAEPAHKPPEPAASRAGSKVERIVTHCVFEISTGAWPPGERLPSVRQAAKEWAVNHLTVLKAYRRLVEQGLVRNVDRSGFFVADSVSAPPAEQRELAKLFEKLAKRFDGDADVSTLAAFRYLADLADARARREPELAFVECTAFQARGHAREVSNRLGVPCMAMTLEELEEEPPSHVRTLLTTGFHARQVRRRRGDARVVTVPIEFSPRLAERLAVAAREVVFFQLDGDVAAHVARDAAKVTNGLRVVSAQADIGRVDDVVRRALRARSRAAVLSPSLWTAASRDLKLHERVFPLSFEVATRAWRALERAARLSIF